MLLCFCKARHLQFLANMIFARRICTSAVTVTEFLKGSGTYILSRRAPSCTTHPSSPITITSPLLNSSSEGQHVYFSRLEPASKIKSLSIHGQSRTDCLRQRRAYQYRSVSRGRRLGSLHWDMRETSLMCLLHSQELCSSATPDPSSEGHNEELDGVRSDEEPPLLFSIKRSTINSALSALTSTLPVQDGLKEVTASLHRLSASIHVQSIFEMSAKPCKECSDDIIIREPIRRDIVNNPPITRPDSESTGCKPVNGQSGHLNVFQSTNSLRNSEGPVTRQSAVHSAVKDHLYFNKVYHIPMVASVPDPSQHQSLVDDEQLVSPQGGHMSPRDDNDQRASKEQVFAMHQRLSEEIPNLLRKSHDYSMYASTVVFDNRIMKFKTTGLTEYKVGVQCMKRLCAVYVMGSEMELIRLTAEVERGVIEARWRVKGVPVHSYVLKAWRRQHPPRYFDAFSTFELGADGLIHRHKLDKVMPIPPDKVRAPSLVARIGIALGLVRNPSLAPDCMVPKPTQS